MMELGLAFVAVLQACTMLILWRRLRAVERCLLPHDHDWHYAGAANHGMVTLRVCCRCGRMLVTHAVLQRPTTGRTLEHGPYLEILQEGWMKAESRN